MIKTFNSEGGEKYMGRLDRLLNKADSLSEKGRFQEALNILNKAHSLEPDNPEVYLSIALTYDAMDQYASSIPFYEKALELDPLDENALTHFGTTLCKLNRYSDALSLFNRALSLDPDNTFAKWQSAIAYKQLGFYEDALKMFFQCIVTDEHSEYLQEELHYQIGLCYYDMGWILEALKQFNKHLAINPDDHWAKLSLGNCYFDMGWINDSISKFKDLVNTNPEFIPGYNSLALSFAEKGWYDEALETLRTAQSIDPDDQSVKDSIDYIESLIEDDGNKALLFFVLIMQLFSRDKASNSPDN